MGIFSRAKNKEELVLVFDIGSSSIKAALFYTQPSGVPRIVASVREPIVLEEEVDVDSLLTLTTKALDVVVEKISKTGFGAPSKVFCVLLSPWYISQTRVISMRRDADFTFTLKLAEDLIKREIDSITEEYLKKYTQVGSTFRPIELKNIKIMLNGYDTVNPINKKAKELEMTVFVSMGSEEVCKKIEETIGKHFSFNKVNFSSFTMASFAVVRDMYAHQENFLLTNIGGEITDIAMVKGNILHESTSFPLGINSIIRKVAHDMGCSLAEAKSFVSLFNDGHAEASVAERLNPVVAKIRSQWLAEFQKSLANLSNDISIPAFVYVSVDKDLADFFAQTIKTEQFNQYTLTESKFQIIFLNIENLRDIAVFEKDSIFNAFLAIDTVYISRFFS